ncbi:MAG: M1 family metallopeptidase [Ignavibacteriae bacterium]|nr:M1 family metallopeptidase [Ignavibacteriota bacterium]MCB9242375.1 M1 family metallopeptidase [Ignavibacteriales bacterium]
MSKFILIVILIIAGNLYSQTIPEPERERTYDVKHISMDLRFNWDEKKVIGMVTTTIAPLSNGMTSFEVDAIAFDIIGIERVSNSNFDGVPQKLMDLPLRYDYDGKKIEIYLPESINKDDSFEYVVMYSCKPQRGLYFIYPTELNPSLPYQIWTQGESENNKYWLPIYDYPNDKTTTEMYITVDDKFTTLSNGCLDSVYAGADGKTTYHWIQDKPHSTYLIMLGVGEWDIVKDYADGLEVMSYVDKDRLSDGEYAVRNTAEMVKLFNDKFGYIYPWANYKQVIVKDFIYGGMENTTATVLNERTYYDPDIENDYGADNLISHELGHQWWGDLITCRNWSELWLNESFATFSAALWNEAYKGKDEYDYYLLRNSDDAMKVDSTKKRLPVWEGFGDITENTYDKGSVMINSFRHVLGDYLFFASLSTFLHDNEFKPVETQDFIDAINKTVNADPNLDQMPKDFTWMVDQWIWKAGYPEFEVSHSYNKNSKEVVLNIKQVQKTDTLTPSFQVPVDVRIYGQGNDTIVPIFISGSDITWTIPFPVQPEFVQFDYGNKIMDKTIYVKFKEVFSSLDNNRKTVYYNPVLQFKNSENAIDRIMAIRREANELILPSQIKNIRGYDFNDYKVFYEDKFWGTRKEAIDFYTFLMTNPNIKYKILPKNIIIVDGKKESGFKQIFDFIRTKYNTEPNSRVKRAMLAALGKSKDKEDIKFIKDAIASATNEYIISDGIKALGEALPKEQVYDAVMPYIFKPSHRWIITNAVVEVLDSADNGAPDPRIKDALISVAFGKDIESRTRTKALTALLDYAKDPEVMELAKRYVDYNFRETKQALIKLLGRSGDKSLIPFLQEMNGKTTDTSINKSIEDAIKELNG